LNHRFPSSVIGRGAESGRSGGKRTCAREARKGVFIKDEAWTFVKRQRQTEGESFLYTVLSEERERERETVSV
jgi:hypothetical protein